MNVKCNFVKTNVTSIKVLDRVVLIGTGSFLHIYDKTSQRIINRTHIFEHCITGIIADENKVLIYGENVIKLFKLVNQCKKISLVGTFIYNDWILTAKFMKDNSGVAVVSMHSNAYLFDENLKQIKSSPSMITCTCYCAHIAYNSWDDLYVFSGTALSQIHIWKPSRIDGQMSPILHTLQGHKGVIFSIDFSPTLKRMCSTSDDGKAILWKFTTTDLDDKTIARIEMQKTIQHQYRTFRCKFLKNYLITTTEDSSFRMYDIHNDSTKVSNHQIGSIWTVDMSNNGDAVITGGADGGVLCTPLPEANELTISNKFLIKAKNMLLLSHEITIYVTEQGNLILSNINETETPYREVQLHEDLKSYSLLEKSPCGNHVALAGYRGNIHIYRFENSTLHYECSCQIDSKPRIFSLHWLSCRTFITCLKDGILMLWFLKDGTAKPVHLMQLPQGKERWSTSATYCGPKNLVVGDRRGSLYHYNLNSNHPVQVFKKIHTQGITNVYSFGNKLIVLGRNAMISKFYFDKNKEELSIITNDKLPFSWLAGYYKDSKSETVLGFANDNFVIWDHVSRRYVLQRYCAGGHRSWDYYRDEHSFTFGYLRNESLHLNSFKKEVQVQTLMDSFHGSETNTMKLIKIRDNPLECVALSGGEDTVLRLCLMDFSDDFNGFQNIDAVKSHLSSIRVLTYHKICNRTKQSHCESYFVFSAGGRAQIILWKLDIIYQSGVIRDVLLVEKFSYYKPLDKDESEMRIMDVVTLEAGDFIVLLAGCSDGRIKVYKVNKTDSNPEIYFVKNVIHKERCILKVFTLKMSKCCTLVAASTDGFLTFFNITSLLQEVKCDKEIGEVEAIDWIRTNQSGINSYSYHDLKHDRFVILTGGDDKSFSLNLIQCEVLLDRVCIKSLASHKSEDYHFAHITGAYISKNYFITASIDQKVIIYKWSLSDNSFIVDPLRSEFTCITDLQGIDYLEVGKELKLVLFGRGVQVLSISL